MHGSCARQHLDGGYSFSVDVLSSTELKIIQSREDENMLEGDKGCQTAAEAFELSRIIHTL